MTDRPAVAFLGLGIMGSRMAANLVAAGFPVRAWTRTEGKASSWAAEREGAVACATPAEAASGAGLVVSMVVDGPQVEAVLLGPGGAADGAAPGTLVVDMSTIGAVAARAVGAALGGRGLRFVDAPVTGSAPKAADGTLTIMAGGEREDVARARPAFEAMGSLVVHTGPVGSGQAVKVLNNTVAAVNAVTVAQALVAADAAGLDLDALTQVVAAGSGASAMLALKAGPMREHDFTPLFKLEHLLKDVRLCVEEAGAAGAGFPLGALAAEVLAAGAGRGLGEQDFAALVEVVEGAAGRRLGPGPA